MKLRTVTCWAIYRPSTKLIVVGMPTKKQLLALRHVPEGCVVVKLKGHYVMPRSTSTTRRGG
jgi:hypothetical protein